MRSERIKLVAPPEFFEPSFPPKSYKLKKDFKRIKGKIAEKTFLGLFKFKESFLEETKIQPRYLVIGETDKEKASREKADKERTWPSVDRRWDRNIFKHQNPHFYISRQYRYWNNPNSVKGDKELCQKIKYLEVTRIQRECDKYKKLVLSSWLEENKLYTPPIDKSKIEEQDLLEKKPSSEDIKKDTKKYNKLDPNKLDIQC